MIIKQLSVFVENKAGRLSEITGILAQAGINISALSLADTADYGMLRLVVSDPEKALAALKQEHISVNLTDVVCLSTPNQPGALAKALGILAQDGVSVEYMYAFSMGDKALVVIKPGEIKTCIEVLQRHEMELLQAGELYRI